MIFEEINKFLEKHHRPGRPILLGFSGGPDSLALCHLLMRIRSVEIDLHLAHVDHGWRPESAEEARELHCQALRLNLPFHICRLEKRMDEAEARQARLAFFGKIYREGGFQALILAHHADDQAETVLKRVLEGSSLFACGGLQTAINYQGMAIWRPLVNIPKASLLAWLEKNGLIPLNDPSNSDPRYLRARMRTQILPALAKTFGKEISANLQSLGQTAQELKHYFARKVSPYLEKVERGPFGSYLDLSPYLPMETVELQALMRNWLEIEQISLSRFGFETTIRLIQSKTADRRLPPLHIDRGRVFALKHPLPSFPFSRPLLSQIVSDHRWAWKIACQPVASPASSSSWRHFWSGRAEACLPPGNYALIPASPHLPYPRTSPIKKLWCREQIPAFLRESLPLIAEEGGRVVHEFLTGSPFFAPSGGCILISLEINRIDN